MTNQTLRADLSLIADLIAKDATVLDVGCSDGALLQYLVNQKGVDGRGIELSQTGVNACVAKGLFVVQGDADNDLAAYPDDQFDYVVLSRTLQAVKNPRKVLLELLRIGRRAIITIPNFGHWRVRTSLLFSGRMPVTKTLKKSWFDTDNIHFCTIRDMFDLIESEGIEIENFVPHSNKGKALSSGRGLANLTADQGLFLLKK